MISRNYKNELDIRKRQIDTLKIFNDNVQEVVENEEYAVRFASGGRQIVIKVYLGAGFPNEKPKLVISPSLNHPWINSASGIVENAPGILNFTHHSDLGRVVHAVIREFEKRPPPFLEDPQSIQNSTLESKNVPSPSVDVNTIDLSSLTIEELERMNRDEDYLEDFVDNLSFIQNQNDEMNNLMMQIEMLACANLTKKEIIDENRKKLDSMFLEFKELGTKYEAANQKYQKKAEDFSPQHIKELLQIAVSTADATSDEHTQTFLNGEIDVNSFLNRFMEAKKLSAMRKAKEDRLIHQLDALERAAL